MPDRIGQAGISGLKLKSQTGDAAQPKIVNQESRSYFCESPIAIQSCWNHTNVPEQAGIPHVAKLTFLDRLLGLPCVRRRGFILFLPDRFAPLVESSGARCSVWGDSCWAVHGDHRRECLTTTVCPVSIRIAHVPGEIPVARCADWPNDHNLFLQVQA